MGKKLLALCVLCLCGLPALAQNTVVTGTVTDSSGVPYAGGTIKATLVLAGAAVNGQPTVTVTGAQACRSSGFGSSPCQVPFQGSVGPATLDNNGSFTLSLQDTSLVTPAGTQWAFSVSTIGAPPPLGTGPQTCSATLTITGALQSITSSFSGCPTLSKVGSTSFVSGQTPITNTFFIADPKYGAKYDGKIFYSNVNTCSWTSGQATVTCTGGGFTSALIGYNVTATINSCCGVANNYLGTLAFANVATTVVSVQSATQLTISQNFTSSSGANWIIGFLPNIDAAWTAMEADANVSGGCYAEGLPAGRMAVLQGHGNLFGTQCGGAEPQADFTANFFGQGKGATVIVPVPGFQTSTCTGGASSDVCFFGAKNAAGASEVTVNFLQFNGLGWGNTGFGSLKKLIGIGLGSETIDLACNAFGGSDTNLIGFSYDGAGVRNVKMSIDGCGNFGARVGNQIAKCEYCFYGDNLGPALTITNSGDYSNVHDDYGVQGGTIVIDQAGRYHGVGSNLFACGAANATAIYMGNGNANTVTILDGARFNCNSPTSNGVFMNQAGEKLVLTGGTHIGGTTAAINRSNTAVVYTSPDTVFDAGAITSIAPTCVMTTGGGTGPACAVLAGSTNEKGFVRMTPGTTPGSTGTTTITFAGTFSGASGATPACFFDPANTGTGVWNIAADTQYQTASTTVPVFTWNNTLALTAASTYDVSYMCIPR